MDHFMIWSAYKNQPYINWRDINKINVETMKIIGVAVEKRKQERNSIIEKDEFGRAQNTDSTAPGNWWPLLQLRFVL